MEIEKVKDKLQKLLALATSPNEHEAGLAMERAAEIAAKYDLDLAMIEEAGVSPEMLQNNIEGLSKKYTKHTQWEASLCNVVAHAFDCRVVVIRTVTPWKLAVLGRKGDTELVQHFFLFLRKQIVELGYENYPISIDERVMYFTAIVQVVGRRLKDMYLKKAEVVGATSKDLVVQKSADSEKFMNEKFPGLRTARKQKLNGSHDAWNKGQADGEKISLHRPVRGGQEQSARLQ